MIPICRESRAVGRVLLAVIAIAAAGIGGMSPVANAQDAAASLSASFRRAAARVKGALVTVRVADTFPSGQPIPSGPGRLIPQLGMPPGVIRSPEVDGPISWTGLVIDAEHGHVLTTERPTQGAIQLVVTFPDGVERLTSEIRRDERSDLALLVVDTQGLRLEPAAWGDPAKLEPGDWLVALGQPGPGPPSLSAGVFSARREARGEFLLETDAAIPRVGAGGVLVNLAGEVVGIGKLGGRRSDGFEGMSHAIPADRARRITADLARFGRARRGHLGLYIDANGPLAMPPGDGQPGVHVSAVMRDSPAAQAGVKRGDIIVAAGGRPVNGVAALQEAVERTPIGDELKLTVRRDGRTLEIPTRPRLEPAPGAVGQPARREPLGPRDSGHGTDSSVPPAPAPETVPGRPGPGRRPGNGAGDGKNSAATPPQPKPTRPPGDSPPPLDVPELPPPPPDNRT